MFYDPRPARRLARVLENYRQVHRFSLSRLHRQFPIGSCSMLRRVLTDQTSLSFHRIKPVANTIAIKLAMAADEFIDCLFRDELPPESRFTELALATVWRQGRRANKRVAEFLTTRLAEASTIIWREPYIPTWLVPDTCLLHYARCSQGRALDLPALKTNLAVARPVCELLLGDPDPARTTFVPVLCSEIKTMLSLSAPFDHFPVAKMSELVKEITHNAVAVHGILPILVEDASPAFPSALRTCLTRSTMFVAVGNDLILKELHGSWFLYDRKDGAETGRYLDAQLQTMGELRQYVRHDLTAGAVIEVLEAFLRALDETRSPNSSEVQTLRSAK